MRLVKANALNSWNHLKESRTLAASEYIEFSGNEVPPPYKLVFVSHRWITAMHPDPHNSQLMELKQRLSNLPAKNGKNGPLLVFFDYCSLPQLPRSAEENLWFERDLRSLESLSRLADYFIILSEGYRDYANRAWCFFEAITARENAHFFSDQNYIKEELKFRTFLMAEDIRQITAYDLSYKPKASEVEIIVAVFQHLQNCRVTHSKDAPKIKDQLIAHYNKRRLTSFGKLVVGIIKHFDVEFAIMPVEDPQKVLVCKPFFEHPDWVRLPSLETLLERFMGGRNSSSLFALPRQVNEDIKRQHHQGFQPLLRLSISGVYNFQNFLEDYKNKPDWKKYVVDPAMLGEKGDCFPEIDNVIHTILELTSGFFLSKDRRYVYFFLSERQMQKKKASVLMLDKDGQVIDNSIWELFKKGESLYSSGRYAEAASCYGEALKTNPQNADAWFNKGNSLYYLGNYKEAINCYRETLKINSKYALAMYNKGLAEDRLGTGRDAAASYQRFIEMAQVELNGHIEIARKRLRELKANNYSSTNYSDEATQGYSKTSYINQKDAETWNNKGVNLDNSGYYEEAIECYDRALKVNPQHALAWYNKGGCLISLKRYNQALECCNKALEINPQYAFAWYNKGIAEDQLALKKEAIISYRKFIEMAQTKHRKQVEYALKRLHELEASSPSNMKDSSVRAKESWEMPVQDEMRPKQPLILDADELLKKGDQCLEQGKCEQALKYFTDALKIKPDDLNLLAYRATALTRLSRNQEAITLIDYILDKHLATGLNLAYMYTGKANALVNLKRFEESLDYYQKALKIAGNVSTIWYMQGFAYYSMSKYELALKNFQKAYALSTDEKTREFIGWCYLGMENYIEALKIFEQLTINPPRDSLSWYGLGLAAKALGKIEQARDCIQRFLNQVKPEHADLIPQANKALKDLKK